ncbi:MAG: RraA family protein [Terriglobia bacterium]
MPLVSLLQELRNFDTALLANTIDHIDPTPAHTFYLSRSIQSVTPSLGPTVGVAATCELDSSTPAGEAEVEGYWSQLEEISRMKEPAVWVVKTVGSRPDHECVLGDGMAKTLYAAGCVGVVTDGGVRDVNGLLTTSFAAYCNGTTIHHCALRFRNIGQPVELGGVTIRTGDILHANSEGVIRIPESCLEVLPVKAIQMLTFENEAHSFLRKTDVPISEKRRHLMDLLGKYGFATYDFAK